MCGEAITSTAFACAAVTIACDVAKLGRGAAILANDVGIRVSVGVIWGYEWVTWASEEASEEATSESESSTKKSEE